MGRPRKYFSAEEIRAAKCLKSKRWYDRNRSLAARDSNDDPDDLTTQNSKCVSTKERIAVTQRSVDKPKKLSPLEYWLNRVQRGKGKLDAILENKGALSFIQGLYDGYIITEDTEALDKAVVAISDLQHRARRYENHILQIAGVGKDLEQAQVFERRVTQTTNALEEVACHTILGLDEMQAMHRRKEFLFFTLD